MSLKTIAGLTVTLLAGTVLVLGSVPVAPVHHDLRVTVHPDRHTIEVTGELTLAAPTPDGRLDFTLHGGLTPCLADGMLRLERLPDLAQPPHAGINSAPTGAGAPTARYRVHGLGSATHLHVSYAGAIHHPPRQTGPEYARGFQESPGLVSPEGVYLAGASYWVPHLGSGMISYRLTVDLPAGWAAVSQGRRTRTTTEGGRSVTTWEAAHPTDEAHLVAAPFTVYEDSAGRVIVQAFLRRPDAPLAHRYLEATRQYLTMYEELIGPYPYDKFALVENFWETGYGMPSFTLLGSRVIRFPFILHSSYPHELLHNWWGNGVFVEYATGNWCEGLTTYLADHLIQEQRGQGREYRRTILQTWVDYAAGGRDFPVIEFRARHDAATSAVGYGKTLMLFHMLRQLGGDEAFIQAIRRLYRDHLFRQASFTDVRTAFEQALQLDLTDFFQQWTARPGAPDVRLQAAAAHADAGGWVVDLTLGQIQPGPSYTLDVPVAVTVSGHVRAAEYRVRLTGPTTRVRLAVPDRPLRVDIDPAFDLFRHLHPLEVPPSLSAAFGAERVVVVLPAAAGSEMAAAWRSLADGWGGGRSGSWTVAVDTELSDLPPDAAVWLLGWENRFRPSVAAALAGLTAQMADGGLSAEGRLLSADRHSLVVAVRNPAAPRLPVILFTADNPRAVSGLARKLPHYGKYSALAFEGDEPDNVFKTQWPTLDSPLGAVLTGPADGHSPPTAPSLPPRAALAVLPPPFSAERLMRHVQTLASPEMEGRGLGSAGLDRAADHIAQAFAEAGLQPAGEDGWFQDWTISPGPNKAPVRMRNVIGRLPGGRPEWAGQAVVVCAHYDHLGFGAAPDGTLDRGPLHPGADDNASGVAVLIELARSLANGAPPERDLLFVAFTGEEHGRLGSRHFLDRLDEQARSGLRAAINLDSVGRLEGRPFLVLGGQSAREWRFLFQGVAATTGVAIELSPLDLDASDQVSFLERGIPAVQLFSGPHPDYHRPGDRPERVDAAGLVQAAVVTREAVTYLAGRPEPLTFAGPSPNAGATAPPPTGGRRGGTGVTPDFTYPGPGVRIGGLADGSPAHAAGLAVGDIILAVEGRAVADLSAYAAALRAYTPGQAVTLTVSRGGVELTTSLVLQAR